MRGHAEFRAAVRQPRCRASARTRPASRSRSSATAGPRTRSGRYLIGADGAQQRGAPLARHRVRGLHLAGPACWSSRRRSISISVIPGLSSVSYVADPERWHFLLQIPGLWRGDVPDQRGRQRRARADAASSRRSLMAGVVPGISELRDRAHHALQGAPARGQDLQARPRLPGRRRRPHQQSARRHGHERRHPRRDQSDDAARRGLARRDADEAELDRYDKQRRLVTLEYIQKHTIQNKNNLESPGDEFGESLRAIAADPARTRDYLMRVSMIASL